MHDFTKGFPFPSKLSLKLLIEYWEKQIRQNNALGFTRGVLEYIENAPELKEPIEDEAIVEKHRPFINYLMSAVVPAASESKDLVAAIYPFTFKPLYLTQAFEKTVDISKIEERAKANLPGAIIALGKAIKGCLMVLEKFYQVGSFSDRPVSRDRVGAESAYLRARGPHLSPRTTAARPHARRRDQRASI